MTSQDKTFKSTGMKLGRPYGVHTVTAKGTVTNGSNVPVRVASLFIKGDGIESDFVGQVVLARDVLAAGETIEWVKVYEHQDWAYDGSGPEPKPAVTTVIQALSWAYAQPSHSC